MNYNFNLIKLDENGNNDYKLKSKLGGKIHLPINIEIPKDQYKENMVMLFQLNLKDFKINDNLPKEGILQFYLAKDGNSSIDWLGESNDSDNYRIIYFEENNNKLNTYENGFENNKELEVNFEEKIDTLYDGIIEFYKEFPKFNHDFMDIVNNKESYNKIDWKSMEEINDRHVIYEEGNHKLLGFPTFYQQDFRRNNEKYKDYILLLQIECSDDDKLSYLGNYANITFFIHPDDLKNLNFDNCIINYDCN